MRRLFSRRRSLRLIPLPALAAAALGGCGGSTQHFTVRHAPLISIFEAPLELANSPGPTLDVLHRLGVQDVRVVVPWASLAPDPGSTRAPARLAANNPAAYPAAGWAPYDAIVREAAARKIGVLLDVSGPAPLWASGRGAPPGGTPGVWKPSASKFRPFVRAVALRYSGHYTPPGARTPLPRISFWSVWNEPNLGEANLAPQAIEQSRIEASPQMYRNLLDAAWASLQATGHGHDTILMGEIAPYGQFIGKDVPGNFGYMVPLRFVRALYCVDASLRPLQGRVAAVRGCPTTPAASKRFARENPALFQASGFAVHPYPLGAVPPSTVLAIGKDFVYLSTLGRLERVLDAVTRRYGVGKQFLLYSTEYGYFTNPPYQAGAPLPLAAKYLNWAEYMTWRMPRLRSWNQYLLVDPDPTSRSNFVTGLEFFGGRAKPTYAAWRMPIFLPVTRERRGGNLEVWGCVRPARYTQRPQDVRIELRPGSHGDFQTVVTISVTDPSGYFDTRVKFSSGGQVRLAWTYPHGPTIFSRQVTISAS